MTTRTLTSVPNPSRPARPENPAQAALPTRTARIAESETSEVPDRQDLQVYRLAFKLAMDVFEASKRFPAEEKYALTDRVRRSSRSVCVQITEAFSKRSYPRRYVETLYDADAENSETQVWLGFAYRCGYLAEEGWKVLAERSRAVGRMIHQLIRQPEP